MTYLLVSVNGTRFKQMRPRDPRRGPGNREIARYQSQPIRRVAGGSSGTFGIVRTDYLYHPLQDHSSDCNTNTSGASNSIARRLNPASHRREPALLHSSTILVLIRFSLFCTIVTCIYRVPHLRQSLPARDCLFAPIPLPVPHPEFVPFSNPRPAHNHETATVAATTRRAIDSEPRGRA